MIVADELKCITQIKSGKMCLAMPNTSEEDLSKKASLIDPVLTDDDDDDALTPFVRKPV